MSIKDLDLELERWTSGKTRFDVWRNRAGFFLAPFVFLVDLAGADAVAEAGGPQPRGDHSRGCGLLDMRIAADAGDSLIGAAACIFLQVADAKSVLAPFADPLIFLFIGSFILARAIFLHDLDKRFAYGVLSLKWIGAKPSRILFAFGAVTAFISGWISNTATTAMMFAIGLSIIHFLFKHEKETGIKIDRNYATALMLITSFAASIGGLATPIGTPPNVIGLGFIRNLLHVEIPFFEWMLIGVPVVVVLYIFLFLYLNYLAPAGVKEISGSAEMIARERAQLGSWTRAAEIDSDRLRHGRFPVDLLGCGRFDSRGYKPDLQDDLIAGARGGRSTRRGDVVVLPAR